MRVYDDNKGVRFLFNNGYGISIVSHRNSYGGQEGFAEVAVIKHDSEHGEALCYDTLITADVIGWLDDDGVADLIERIKKLPQRDHWGDRREIDEDDDNDN